MNATEAINKIAELLGMKFNSLKFFQTKLIDNLTTITNNKESEFAIGDELFVVEDSVLKPAPAGSHETREGLLITIGEDSIISKIEEKLEPESISESIDEIETPEVMSKAKLTDGTEIETDESGDFAVGQKLYAITKEGEKVPAPEGEHTTESGIVLTVDSSGTITGVKYPDEAGEGSLQNDMKKMQEAMAEMFSLIKDMNANFETTKKEFESFRNSPVFETPVVKKTFAKENLLDTKMEFLKQAIRL